MWGVAGDNLKVETRVAHKDRRHCVLTARDRVLRSNLLAETWTHLLAFHTFPLVPGR